MGLKRESKVFTVYPNLGRLGTRELETAISDGFEIQNVTVIPGRKYTNDQVIYVLLRVEVTDADTP